MKEKFTESEMIVGGLGALFVDAISGVIDFFTVGTSTPITAIAQAASTGAIEWWIKEKGGDLGIVNLKRLAKYAANALPVVPTVFIIFLASVFVHNNSELTEATGKIAGKIGPKKGAATKTLKKAA